MTLDRFKEIVTITDFLFIHGDDECFIDPMGSNLYLASKTGEDTQEFHSLDALLNDFVVSGKPLKDIIPEIEWD